MNRIKIYNYKKGKEGEEIARKHLEESGFELIEANYSNDIGEVDLIMKDKEWLVFVEVKLKIGDKFGNPEEMIGKNKINQIKRVAQIYLMLNQNLKRQFVKYRIDAVCIVKGINGEIERIKHYRNIY